MVVAKKVDARGGKKVEHCRVFICDGCQWALWIVNLILAGSKL